MRNSIYAVDFDGTLCENKWPEIGEANDGLINFLINKRRQGSEVILYTMREGQRLDEAVSWCKTRGLIFDAVNDNTTTMKGVFGNNPRKVYADFYIDDHNDPNNYHLPYHAGKAN